jgi:hypothetical protein
LKETLTAAGGLDRIGRDDEELPAEVLDVGNPFAQTVEMAAQAIVIGIASVALSLKLPELKPQPIEFDTKSIASHAAM